MGKNIKHAGLHMQLKKTGDKLVYINSIDKISYDEFVKSLDEGQNADIFYDSVLDTGTLAQIAKIYACIREISSETGSSFEDMKLTVKRKSGMCMKKIVDGEAYIICKSFGDCSKEELGLVINTIIEIGDMCNINMR